MATIIAQILSNIRFIDFYLQNTIAQETKKRGNQTERRNSKFTF